MFFSKEFASAPQFIMETPLPIFEDSGSTPKNHNNNNNIISSSPPPLANNNNIIISDDDQEVFISDDQELPPSSNNNIIIYNNGISPNDDYGINYGSNSSSTTTTKQSSPAAMEEDIIDKEFFHSLPPGYRFCPSDTDLIVHYLQKKIDKEKLPRNQIRAIKLYEQGPHSLSEKYPPIAENEWYFFTSRDRKYRNGLRPNRAAGFGYWKATGADKPIFLKGVKVGFRKALVYYQGRPAKGCKTNWIMHEYRVVADPRPKSSATDMMLDECVLCRIYKKIDKSFKPRPRNHEDANEYQALDQNVSSAEINRKEEQNDLFDQPGNCYLSDVDNTKNDFHLPIDDEEFKNIELASAGFMESQFSNGLGHAMDPSFASYGNYSDQLPLTNYQAKSPSAALRPSPMDYATENNNNAFISKHMMNEAIKPRVIDHDNPSCNGYNNIEDYGTCSLNLPTGGIDFSTPNVTIPDLDNLINCPSYETNALHNLEHHRNTS